MENIEDPHELKGGAANNQTLPQTCTLTGNQRVSERIMERIWHILAGKNELHECSILIDALSTIN